MSDKERYRQSVEALWELFSKAYDVPPHDGGIHEYYDEAVLLNGGLIVSQFAVSYHYSFPFLDTDQGAGIWFYSEYPYPVCWLCGEMVSIEDFKKAILAYREKQ